MLLLVQHILFAGRPGRVRGEEMAAVDKVRGGAGYGDGSMHDDVLVGVPGHGETTMEHGLSAPDQPGLYQPLHAHVCDVDDGRDGAES